jgi:hypothetical protein
MHYSQFGRKPGRATGPKWVSLSGYWFYFGNRLVLSFAKAFILKRIHEARVGRPTAFIL